MQFQRQHQAAAVAASGTGTPADDLCSVMTLALEQMTFVAPIVTLTLQTMEEAAKMGVERPLTYPMLRAQTTSFPIATGTNSLNIQMTGQRRPQVMFLHFVPTRNLNPGLNDRLEQNQSARDLRMTPFSCCTFAEGFNSSNPPYPATFGAPQIHYAPPCVKISSLYLRCGGFRFPATFDRTRDANGPGTFGGTSQIEYEEYANLTRQYMDGDKDGLQPFLTKNNFEDPVLGSLFIFNMAPNGETFQDRSVIETMNITGTVDIIAQLQASIEVPVTLVVTALTNEKFQYSILQGTPSKSW